LHVRISTPPTPSTPDVAGFRTVRSLPWREPRKRATDMRRIFGALLLAGTVASTGCASGIGTLMTEGRNPYVGVCLDAAFIAENPAHDPGLTLLAMADFPLSFATDTLMLPVTATRAVTKGMK
jgi:uncharacterized protein YceK